MAKRPFHLDLAGIEVVRDSAAPLVRQLYQGLRQAIFSGQLRPGTRLPSTRILAADTGVSRNTVVAAFEQLLAEGYVEGKLGSGTYVASSLPDQILSVGALPPVSLQRPPPRVRLSRSGKVLATHPVRLLTAQGVARPFASGHPDMAAFPIKVWTRLTARRWRNRSDDLLAYGDPAGYMPLRQAIASYVRTVRGVRCEAEQLVIVSGSQQAIDLLARLLLNPGDPVLVEDPGYPGARAALTAEGVQLVRLPVDAEGANIQKAGRANVPIRLAFVTPSHQYPLGVTMTLSRRLALLQWARREGAWILEDDYDSDYRYRGKPLPSLQGLDGTGRVIYMGSFSKTVLPSLRLGFLVLPDALVEPFRRARAVVDGHSPVPYQAVLADFISEGHFARHIRRMRALYAERQSVLLDSARSELAGLLELHRSDGGMHLVGMLPPGVSDVVASQQARLCDVLTVPLSSCAFGTIDPGGLLLGYAAFQPNEIRDAVRRLVPALTRAIQDCPDTPVARKRRSSFAQKKGAC